MVTSIKNSSSSDKLLDAHSMDGPTIPWTVADIFRSQPRTLLTYHVMSSGYHAFTVLGAVSGAALYGLGIRKYRPIFAMMGTSAFVVGLGGMLFGYGGMRSAAVAAGTEGTDRVPPWTEEGIQTRVDGLNHNFKARLLDLSSWSGMSLATAAMLVAGGPAGLGLSAGALGVLQAVGLGSAAGSSCAIGYMIRSHLQDKKLEEEDDDDDN